MIINNNNNSNSKSGYIYVSNYNHRTFIPPKLCRYILLLTRKELQLAAETLSESYLSYEDKYDGKR